MSLFTRNKTTRPSDRPYSCPECGDDLPREWHRGNGPAPAPVHCLGSRVAYQARRIESPHHGRHRYEPCWSCGESLGCDQCAGSPTEVLCTRCAAWGTPEALAHHGPILDTPTARAKRGGTVAPQVASYPAPFRAAYALEPVPIVPMPAAVVRPVPESVTHTAAELHAQAEVLADDEIPF